MMLKKISLLAGLLTVLTAATAGLHWWKSSNRAGIPRPELPSPAEELQKMVRHYRRMADTSASVAATIRIYDQENKSALKETRTFRYLRSGAGYFMQLSYLQTWCDGKWVVQLDTVNRQIVVARAPAGGTGSTEVAAPPGVTGLPDGASLEALFSDTARFRMYGTVTPGDGSMRRLRIQSEFNPGIRSATMVYDTLSYTLDRSEIEFWKSSAQPGEQGNKIWLARIDYQYPPATRIDIPGVMKTIVTIKGQTVTAGAAYRDYQLNLNNGL